MTTDALCKSKNDRLSYVSQTQNTKQNRSITFQIQAVGQI